MRSELMRGALVWLIAKVSGCSPLPSPAQLVQPVTGSAKRFWFGQVELLQT